MLILYSDIQGSLHIFRITSSSRLWRRRSRRKLIQDVSLGGEVYRMLTCVLLPFIARYMLGTWLSRSTYSRVCYCGRGRWSQYPHRTIFWPRHERWTPGSDKGFWFNALCGLARLIANSYVLLCTLVRSSQSPQSSLRSDAFSIYLCISESFSTSMLTCLKFFYPSRALSLRYVNFLQAWFEESNRRILLLSIKVVKTWIGSALEWRSEHWDQLSLNPSWSLDHSCWIRWCWFIPHLRNHLHYPHQLVSNIHWYSLHHSHSALCLVSGWYLFICSPHSKERI